MCVVVVAFTVEPMAVGLDTGLGGAEWLVGRRPLRGSFASGKRVAILRALRKAAW
jgi:hypothetical protein